MRHGTTLLGSAAIGLTLGLGLGWVLWRPSRVVETYAQAVRQVDGSLVLERKPNAKAVPKHTVPRGATVERVASVTVLPSAPPIPTSSSLSPELPGVTAHTCPPVTVDLSLVRLKDGTRRIIASSPDGEVVGGVDIPIESAPPNKDLKNAGGVSYNPLDKTYGLWYQRNKGPLVMGLDVLQQKAPLTGASGVAVSIRLGVRF